MTRNTNPVIWVSFAAGSKLPSDRTPSGVFVGSTVQVGERAAVQSRRVGFGHPWTPEDLAWLKAAGAVVGPAHCPADWRSVAIDAAVVETEDSR